MDEDIIISECQLRILVLGMENVDEFWFFKLQSMCFGDRVY